LLALLWHWFLRKVRKPAINPSQHPLRLLLKLLPPARLFQVVVRSPLGHALQLSERGMEVEPEEM
jgi:hypothetical protein